MSACRTRHLSSCPARPAGTTPARHSSEQPPSGLSSGGLSSGGLSSGGLSSGELSSGELQEEPPVTRHYLDHASTSPPRPEVVAAMVDWLEGRGVPAADPGRVHTEGRAARQALEDAHDRVAEMLGTRPRQVVFTSGATESVNAATWAATTRASRVCGGALRSRALERPPGIGTLCTGDHGSGRRLRSDSDRRLGERLGRGDRVDEPTGSRPLPGCESRGRYDPTPRRGGRDLQITQRSSARRRSCGLRACTTELRRSRSRSRVCERPQARRTRRASALS